MSAAAPLARIALAPLQQWRNNTPRWVMGLVVAVPLLGMAITALAGSRSALLAACGSVALALVVAGWLALVNSLVGQNEPRAARLVPGHVLRLRQVLLGAWALLGVVALGVGLVIGQPLLALMATGLSLLVMAASVRWPWLWALIWIVPTFAWRFRQWPGVQAVLDGLQRSHRDAPVLTTAIVMAGMALLLAQLLQAGGSRHASSYRQHQRRAKDMRQSGAHWMQQGALAGWLQYLSNSPYRWWFARQVARPPGPVPARGVLGRGLLALGPSSHWTGHAASALIGIVIAGASLLLSRPYWQAAHVSVNLVGVGIGMMIFAINPVLQVRAALYNSRREQALMMLLPGMPRGAALNHAWARRQMVHFFIAWAASAAFALLVVNRWNDMPMATFFLCMGCLPIGLTLWRDWAGMKPPSTLQSVLLALLPVAAGGIGLAAHRGLGLGPGPWAVLCVAATVLLGVWRWRRLGRFASAFPAGRRG